jgi:hypothetical protein
MPETHLRVIRDHPGNADTFVVIPAKERAKKIGIAPFVMAGLEPAIH